VSSVNGENFTKIKIERLIEDIKLTIYRDMPNSIGLFEVFAQEAIYGRQWLEPSLKELNPGDAILEVGSGLMLLGCQLVSEGYRVTALEPIGEGFSDFLELQNIILDYAQKKGIAPNVEIIKIEELSTKNFYNFAFSINVMEHISDIEQAIINIGSALKYNASYRFICPNYIFPYEPHFNIPIFFSKKLTNWLFKDKITHNTRMSNPIELWNSLNWINVLKINKIIKKNPNLTNYYNRHMLEKLLSRITYDNEFASRRSGWMRRLISIFVFFKLHKLSVLVPITLQPIIDCSIIKLK
jgi:2-polyprenyl-3-methyl-5-hydroxy-6-metoxy-1,4-benzoquinol methylase